MTINRLFVYLWCPEGQPFLQDRQPTALDHERFQRKVEIWKYIVWRCAWCVCCSSSRWSCCRDWSGTWVPSRDSTTWTTSWRECPGPAINPWSGDMPAPSSTSAIQVQYLPSSQLYYTLHSFLCISLPYTKLFFKSTRYLVCPTIFTWTDPRTLILDNKETKHKPLQAHSRQLPHG